ncbi:hypothetical protein WN943_026521 [Citrus x changshan-huyou]
MSTSARAQASHDPNPNLHKPEPKESVNLFSTVNVPPDPLLDSGFFIDAAPPATSGSNTTTTNDQTSKKRGTIREHKSENLATTNGTESALTPETASTRRLTAMEAWLPPGWEIEDRVRTSGATAGTVDKYYFHVASGRRFRSKKEVLYFLETGTKRKRRKENSNADMDSSGSAAGSTKQKKPNIKAKTSALNFDYFNSPENVEWVLTDPSEGSWTPFIGKVEVPESVRQDWAAAFTDLTTSNNGSKIC